MLDSNYLFTSKNLMCNNIKFQDIKVYPGQIVYIESKDIHFSNIFISLLFGQIKRHSGSLKFSNLKMGISNYKKISYISNAFFFPNVKSIEELVISTAQKKGFMPSKIFNEFSRILKLINLDYVLKMNISEVNFNSKKKIITALSLALPMLLVILNEPFIDVDNETKLVFFDEIKKLSVEGSSVFVLASEADRLEYDLFYKSN